MDAKNFQKNIMVVAVQSDSHIVTVVSKGIKYKLFQIKFGNKGDIYVNFPYYKHSHGIVARATLPPNATSVNLADEAGVTSHRIKFSHHMDGNAHFSQSGKVMTKIRNRSVPLRELNGHLFTVSLQNITHFDEAKGAKYNHGCSPERSVITFDATSNEFDGLKFVASWQSLDEFAKGFPQPIKEDRIGPKFIYKGNPVSFGFFLGPSQQNPMIGHVLSLRMHAIPKLSNQNESLLTFLGGFDSNIRNSDPSKDYHFLALMYPYKLKNEPGSITLESIDLIE